MGTGLPNWPVTPKKKSWSAVRSWLFWGVAWTAVLGVSLALNLQAARHLSRRAAVQAAAAAVAQEAGWQRLAADYRLYVPRPEGKSGAELMPVLLGRNAPPKSGFLPVNLDALLCQLRRAPAGRPESQDGVRVRVTPLARLNGTERQALAKFRDGAAEETVIGGQKGKEQLHLLRPEGLDEECRRCHQQPAASPFGVVKGSLPLQPFLDLEREYRLRIAAEHAALWLAGIFLLGAGLAREQRVRAWQLQVAGDLQQWQAMREQLDECPDGLCVVRDNIIRYANRRLAAMIGTGVADMIASPLTSFLPAGELVRFSREIGRLDGAGARFDSALLHREGGRVEVEVHAGTVPFAGGEACMLALREIGARRQREEAAESSLAFLRSILDSMSESVLVFDADYRLLTLNKTARQLYGDDTGTVHSPFCFQLVHRGEERCPDGETGCPMKQVVESRKSCRVLHTHRTTDGRDLPVEILAAPIFDEHGGIAGIVEVGREASHWLRQEEERRRSAEELGRREKEEAIATLAGGLAHDYNNILAVILGGSELLRLKMAAPGEEPKLLGSIHAAASRMADLNRQLLASAGLGPRHARLLDLNPVVKEVMGLHPPPAGVRTRLNLAADLWPVRADADQMRQLLGNLLVNGFEVLGEMYGRVTVATANAGAEKDRAMGERQLPAGDYVRVAVSDSGPGIEKEILTRIFDPFFSTKLIGRGLGLAAAKGIVESHGGAITVRNGSDRGCTFEIFLPRAAPEFPAGEAS